MYYVLPLRSLDCGYYDGVEDTTDTANVLYAIFHMVSQSSILNQSIQPLS